MEGQLLFPSFLLPFLLMSLSMSSYIVTLEHILEHILKYWHRLPREVIGDPHPWKHSSSGWMGLWATWSSGMCPCIQQEIGLDGLWRFPPTQTILWLSDSLTLQIPHHYTGKSPPGRAGVPLPHAGAIPKSSSQGKAPHRQWLLKAHFISKRWGKRPSGSRYQLEKGSAVAGTMGGHSHCTMPLPSCCSLKIKRRARGARLFPSTSQHDQMLLPMRIRHHLVLRWSQPSLVCSPSTGRWAAAVRGGWAGLGKSPRWSAMGTSSPSFHQHPSCNDNCP